jgi:hypothetical protein
VVCAINWNVSKLANAAVHIAALRLDQRVGITGELVAVDPGASDGASPVAVTVGKGQRAKYKRQHGGERDACEDDSCLHDLN